jgi:hypothetical protein
MNKKRDKPDGLPYRVYERRGVRQYSIGYKQPDGKWAFRLSCPASDRGAILELRSEAIRRASYIALGRPTEGSVDALIKAWFSFHDSMPEDSEEKRAKSTMDENRNEAERLRMAFGHMAVADLTKPDAYAYLDACVRARRPAKGNKEIGLMRLILEHAVRTGMINMNPFDGVTKNRTAKVDRLVSDQEIQLAVEVARQMGGPQLIVGLALKTAWLCLRRSVEVRAFSRDQIKPEGIIWTAAKRQAGQSVKVGLIEWSDELRATVDEALAIPRNNLAGTWYVFGNLSGQRYTKGGWKKTLSVLMKRCVEVAAERKIAFQPFSLQDCRPKGVSDKLAAGALDTVDATLHSSDRMIRQVYDRRRLRIAKPVE